MTEKNQKRIGNRTREVISGLSAGLATTIITHPLDLIKVRLQLDTSINHWQGIRKIVRNIQNDAHGNTSAVVRQIYRGIFPNLVGNMTAWSLYFMTYNEFKNLSSEYLVLGTGGLHSGHYLLSSFSAGLSTSLLTNPIWVLKTRILSTNKSHPGAYQSLFEGIRRIASEEGILGFWKGLTPSFFGVFQSALQFTIYDTLKSHVIQRNKNKELTTSNLTTLQFIYTSAISKMTSATLLYPAQLIRSRLQGYGNVNNHLTMKDVMVQVFRNEGFFGFYKGLLPNLFRVVPATCITFLVYENVKLVL